MHNSRNALFILVLSLWGLKSYGQATTLGSGNITAGNIGLTIMNVTPNVSNPVANFSLVQATSNANLTQVQFTTTGTYTTSDITSFTLYVDTASNALNGSIAVPTASVAAAGPGLQTITLSTPYTLSTTKIAYYFYIVPTFAASPTGGHTIAVSAMASSNISVSTGSVSGSATAGGTLTIFTNPSITGTTGGSRCGTGTVNLSASATTGATINWYNVLTGGSSLGSGGSFTTPSISSNTPFYAGASQNLTFQTGTISDNTTNLVGPYPYYARTDLEYFSSTSACTINSVDVYPSATGTIIITLCNTSGYGITTGTPIATSAPVTISAGQVSNTVPVTIPLGFSIPAGATNYQLGGSTSGTATIYRGDANSTYGPYPMTINGFSITGDAGGNSTATGTSGAFTGYGARCYFYNWNITVGDTVTPLTTVTATVNPAPTGVTATATPNPICLGKSLLLSGTATGATAYSWTGPGGNAISNPNSLTSASVTAVAAGNAGTYTLTTSVGSCSVTATTAILTVNSLPTPTFTSTPSAPVCTNASVTYATQTAQSAYNWVIPGLLGTDYSIVGGGTSTNTITLNWLTTGSKTVTVNYNNAAGCTGASAATNTVTVNPQPAPSFTVSPTANGCVGSSVTYATQGLQSAYAWTVPGSSVTDYNITAGGTGAGNNSVTLKWLTTGSKTVTVNYNNSNGCTGAVAASSTTTINALPTPSFTTAPGANTCSATNAIYTTQGSQSSYTWSVPGTLGSDYSIVSGGTGGGSNSVTLSWLTSGSKNVTVNYTNPVTGCTGSAASNSTTVNLRPTPSFSTSPAASNCVGTTVTYTTQSGQSSYVWSVPGGLGTDYSIVSGGTGGGNSGVTLTWLSAGSKNVTVNYSSSGCTGVTPASSNTTINALPVPTFTSFAGAGTCVGNSVTYTTQPGEGTYTWSVPGSIGIDYLVSAGGISTGNSSATLTWLTTGSKTVTVNYADGNGCTGASAASSTTFVNPLPVPSYVSAPLANICMGNSVTYSTQSGQASYSWSVPGINGTDYIITSGGISSGNNTVTLNWLTTGGKNVSVNYTDVNGCTGASAVSDSIFVNPLPANIGGPVAVCQASSVNLTDTSTGGTWSSSSSSVATVDPVGGNVTGESAGAAVITYTLPTGCYNTQGLTVNPLPGAIGGSANVCQGLTTPLTDGGGGTWSTDNTSVATINKISGVLLGVSHGTANVTYTLPTGCQTSLAFLVNPLPDAITGTTNVCAGLTTTLSDDVTGGSWSTGSVVASVDPSAGTVFGISAGAATVTYTLPTSCATTTTVIVNPLPAAITGAATVCATQSTMLIDAGGGTWSNDNTSVATIDMASGNLTGVDAGSTNVTYTLPTGCVATTSFVVDAVPDPITGTAAVCVGLLTDLSDDVSGGTWSSSSHALATVGLSSGVVAGAAAGVPNITYTTGNGCFVTIAVTVNPLPAVYSVVGGGAYCSGGAGVHIELTGSQAGINYQILNTGAPAALPVTSTGGPIDFGLFTIGGSYTVVALNTTTSCTDNMSGTRLININPLPTVYAVSGGGSFCSGGTGLPVILSGTDHGIHYQLYRDVAPVGAVFTGFGSGITFGPEATAGSYTVVATNPTTGCTDTMAGSATITENSLPSVFSITGGGSYCAGAGGLHIGLTGSATGISYQLFYGISMVDSPLLGTGAGLDYGAFTLDEIYHVVAKDTATGCKITMSGTVSIVTNPLPTIHSVTGGGNYCAGGAGVHIGLDGSNTGISYQLYNGSGAAGGPVTGLVGPADFGLETVTGTYFAVAKNISSGCTDTMTGTAAVATTPTVTPTISVSTGTGDTLCSGHYVTLTAAVTNAGSSPGYAWHVNGIGVSATGNTYSYVPSAGDHVTATLTSSAACATPPVVSNTLDLTVFATGSPSVTIASSSPTTVCSGTSVGYNATFDYGGGFPGLIWMINTIPSGSGASFSYIPSNHDVVSCLLISDYICRSDDSATSNNITMEVDNAVSPTVSITTNPSGPLSNGETVTLTAGASNAGPDPTYQWLVNGKVITGATFPIYTTSLLVNGDSVTCVVTSSGGCAGIPGFKTIHITVTNVGVTQVSNSGADIRLAPNPNKGAFTLKGHLPSGGDRGVTVVVTNMIGQTVYSNTFTAYSGEVNEQIVLSNSLANGMYLLNLRSGADEEVFHFVIQQ